MNAPGPSIERSTWLSAARCITMSGAKSLKSWRILNVSTIYALKMESRIRRDVRKRVDVTGVSQLVDDQHLMIRRRDQLPDHCRSDKAGAAGDEVGSRHRRSEEHT